MDWLGEKQKEMFIDIRLGLFVYRIAFSDFYLSFSVSGLPDHARTVGQPYPREIST